eukprot:CAMPEP_0203884990 /NCGR_PEP_ID=MMETSP0359-20131031/28998_1 /ASSEMBLY_ACC=CAM_ASM_000338 /TAXON_ID=268821 /ORGANISM="Scrippsiella Hangoei, Strain SHTV-5" /LENGTH=37 /DNA_ID= /DNA_START= /DNA_END= /DNA_ORIENTATION=
MAMCPHHAPALRRMGPGEFSRSRNPPDLWMGFRTDGN